MSEHRECLYQHKNHVGSVHAVGRKHCVSDGDPWPCDATIAAFELAETRAAIEAMEAWMTHAISVMQDRRLVSQDQIEDGLSILALARTALEAGRRGKGDQEAD